MNENHKPRPDYPPKTPPPPKRPPSPPPPDPPRSEAEQLLDGLPVPQRSHSRSRSGPLMVRNRQVASWALETGPWIPKKAAGHVTGRLADWGFRAPGALHAVVFLIVATVITDGGRRISVHLSEQNGRILVLALGHQVPATGITDSPLSTLRSLGVVSCGTETTEEGRQVWALLDLPSAAAAQTGRAHGPVRTPVP